MKKVAALTFALSLSLTLPACGSDPAVQSTIEAINAIEEVDASDVEAIEEAQQLYESLNDSQREQVDNYLILEDAIEQLPELRHEREVENDHTAPIITGIEDGQVIDVTCGTSFNLSEYLSERVSVSDDVSRGIIGYEINLSDKVFDITSGNLNTQEKGEYPLIITAEDEAGNIAELNAIVRLSPIHVSADNPHPVVYDGEYGSISVSRFSRGWFYGRNCYYVVFNVTNNTESPMRVCLKNALTTVNDIQVGAYYYDNFIPSGVTGEMECTVEIEEIPFADGEYETIESSVCLFEEQDGEDYYYIPIVFDVDSAY